MRGRFFCFLKTLLYATYTNCDYLFDSKCTLKKEFYWDPVTVNTSGWGAYSD